MAISAVNRFCLSDPHDLHAMVFPPVRTIPAGEKVRIEKFRIRECQTRLRIELGGQSS
jgi:hypothetical protein